MSATELIKQVAALPPQERTRFEQLFRAMKTGIGHSRLPDQPQKPDSGEHLRELPDSPNVPSAAATSPLEDEFNERAERWELATAVQSSPTRKFMHEDYQTIMTMGEAVIPLILKRLQTSPNDWFWALKHLAREDVAAGKESLGEAIEAWLSWGKQRGFIS